MSSSLSYVMDRNPPPDSTQAFLRRMHAGDPEAHRDLLERHLPWIREQVRYRVRRFVGNAAETDDVVHDVACRVLMYGPRWFVPDPVKWRRLLLHIVCNRLRTMARSERLRRGLSLDAERDAGEPLLVLEAGAASGADGATASVKLDRRVEKAWMRLALELEDPQVAELVELRALRQMDYAAIGERMGISADAARQRFDRAWPRFVKTAEKLKAGQLGLVLDELERLEMEGGDGVEAEAGSAGS